MTSQLSQVTPELLANITLFSFPESGWWSCIQLLAWGHWQCPRMYHYTVCLIHAIAHKFCSLQMLGCHIRPEFSRKKCIPDKYVPVSHNSPSPTHWAWIRSATELTQNSHIAYSTAKGYQHADQLKTGCDSDLHTYDRHSCGCPVVCSCITDNGTWTNSPPGKDYKPNRQQAQKKQELFSFDMWQIQVMGREWEDESVREPNKDHFYFSYFFMLSFNINLQNFKRNCPEQLRRAHNTAQTLTINLSLSSIVECINAFMFKHCNKKCLK